MDDPRPGIAEMLRVSRRRFAVAPLNRQSALYSEKGREGGKGAYRGARWYTPAEIGSLLIGLPAARLTIRTAVFDARAGWPARAAEALLPNLLPWGAMIVIAGEVARR